MTFRNPLAFNSTIVVLQQELRVSKIPWASHLTYNIEFTDPMISLHC